MVQRKAVVLVSGGLDSATALAIAGSEGFELHAISFDYGQRHRFELEAASKTCKASAMSKSLTAQLSPACTTAFAGRSKIYRPLRFTRLGNN